MMINRQQERGNKMNTEREEPDFELRGDDLWDASCWPFVTVRGDYEYTLVKNVFIMAMEMDDPEVEAPAPRENDGWDTCPFQHSTPSPLDQTKREQYLRNEQAFAATFIDDGKVYVEDGTGYVHAKRTPRPKECDDCLCLYADLNVYTVYRRKVTP
jgi:hypothetical protein